MKQKNQMVRQIAKKENIRLWEIGEKLGMSDASFSRLLRKELDEATKARIFAIIRELKAVN